VSVILGINAFHAGAAAAVVVDGKPVAAIAEERLNRVKYYAAFPKRSIQRCLDMAGLRFRDIDAVAVGRDRSANRAKKLQFALSQPTKLLNLARFGKPRRVLDDLGALVAQECNVDPAELRFTQHHIEHHIAHTASAFYISPWERAAGLTVDGSGDFCSVMMSECEGDEIRVKHRIYIPHSLGTLYTMICEFIGYGKYGDEGKVMGLAPLGRDTLVDTFADMIELVPDGFRLNPSFFVPFGSNQGMRITAAGKMVFDRHYSQQMEDRFGAARRRHAEIRERDQDLAFALQQTFERAYMHLLHILHRMVPEARLALAGGCALNSCANGKIFDQSPFRETCIQPAAGDDGLALGAALYVSNVLLKEGYRWEMADAYLGPEYSEAEIRAALDERGIAHTRLEREPLLRETVEELEKGNVVGWYQGRMEWGPRALGNRSILTHPGLPGMKDVLNARIKHREPFRPFAPSVLAERQTAIFEHDHPSPFMLHVYKIRPEWRERLSAVCHVDDTGRLQSVKRDENPLYYDLIRAFEARTGLPVLLNTSFNENEPIVQHPAEAIDCFLRTKMDVLVIGPYFCRKSGAPLASDGAP
jgi:carbamoyltransferase